MPSSSTCARPETAAGVIEGAVLIPMDEIEERKRELPTDGRAMLVYCAAGGRSAAVCDHLSKEGFENLHNLDRGLRRLAGREGTDRFQAPGSAPDPSPLADPLHPRRSPPSLTT